MSDESMTSTSTVSRTTLTPSIWHERALAFAGVCQAAVCVQQLARRGEITPASTIDVLINSLFSAEPTTEGIYQPVEGLQAGLKVLARQLDGASDKDVEQTRYVVGMLQLERRLAKSPGTERALVQSMEQITRQRHEFNFSESDILANLARTYSDTISQMGPRIHIQGDPSHLTREAVQHKIRALLLAGIRSAEWWRGLGGKRRQIIFNRRQLLLATQDLINALANPDA